jgi:hypothetical protein
MKKSILWLLRAIGSIIIAATCSMVSLGVESDIWLRLATLFALLFFACLFMSGRALKKELKEKVRRKQTMGGSQ